MLLSAPGLLWGTFWKAWGAYLERFGMIFGTQGGVRSENSDKLEFDDPLNENAMFLSLQRLQNEPKMAPMRAEERKKSRECREKREKYADECLRSARERARARRRPPESPPGGVPAVRRRDRTDLLFPRFRLDFRARGLRNLGFGSNSRNQRFWAR